MNKFKILFLKEKFAIAKLKAISAQQISNLLNTNSFCSIVNSHDETSIICEEDKLIENIECEKPWSAIKIIGPIPFDAFGVLNNLLTPIVAAKVSVLVVSTFNTDYIFFKSVDASLVRTALASIIE